MPILTGAVHKAPDHSCGGTGAILHQKAANLADGDALSSWMLAFCKIVLSMEKYLVAAKRLISETHERSEYTHGTRKTYEDCSTLAKAAV
jgi:hypothetical protein